MEWECDEVTKKACYSKGKSEVRGHGHGGCQLSEGWNMKHVDVKAIPDYGAVWKKKSKILNIYPVNSLGFIIKLVSKRGFRT